MGLVSRLDPSYRLVLIAPRPRLAMYSRVTDGKAKRMDYGVFCMSIRYRMLMLVRKKEMSTGGSWLVASSEYGVLN